MGRRQGSVEPVQAWQQLAETMTVLNDALEVTMPDRTRSCDSSVSAFPKQVAYWSSPTLSATSAFESSARGKPLRGSGDSMSQKVNPEEDEDMLPEYDFADGVRGKHHEAYQAGTNVIFLEPDLAKVFKDSESVNRVLRLLLNLANENVATNRPA
jgi:hypothetical protein